MFSSKSKSHRELDEQMAKLAQELTLKNGQLERAQKINEELTNKLEKKELSFFENVEQLVKAKGENEEIKENTKNVLGCLAKEKQAELAKLWDENAQIAEELSQTRIKCNGFEKELKDKLEEIGKMALVLKEEKTQSRENVEANALLTREMESCLQKLQTIQKDYGKLSGENEKLKNDKSQMDEELALSVAQIRKLEIQNAKMDGLLTEKNEIVSKEELARARMARQIEELQMALEGANANLKEAKEEGTSKDKQIAEFEKKILKLEKNYKSVEDTCQRTKAEYDKLIEELSLKMAKIDDITNNLKLLLEKELECGFCLDLLEEPKQLICGHLNCAECVQVQIGNGLVAAITCSQCSSGNKVPANGQFPTSFLAKNLLAHIKQAADRDRSAAADGEKLDEEDHGPQQEQQKQQQQQPQQEGGGWGEEEDIEVEHPPQQQKMAGWWGGEGGEWGVIIDQNAPPVLPEMPVQQPAPRNDEREQDYMAFYGRRRIGAVGTNTFGGYQHQNPPSHIQREQAYMAFYGRRRITAVGTNTFGGYQHQNRQ